MTAVTREAALASTLAREPDLTHWRDETPGCVHRNHLNNAGAALMPEPVIRAIEDHVVLEAHIGGYEAAEERVEQIDGVYQAIASLINAAPRNVAVTSSSTAAFIQALSSIDFQPGDVILRTSRCDYTSNQIHYLSLARRHGVRVVRAADLPEGGVDPDSVKELARETRPRLVAVSWVPTNSGLVQDVVGVGEVCASLELSYLVDACQAAGQIPIDVDALHCDFLSLPLASSCEARAGSAFSCLGSRARREIIRVIDMRDTWTAPMIYRSSTTRAFEDVEFPYALVFLGSALCSTRSVWRRACRRTRHDTGEPPPDQL